MKNKWLLLFSICMGLSLAAMWLLHLVVFDVSTAQASSLTVCPAGPPTCDYSVIQDAVDAAGDGDVIKVAAGTYDDVNNRSDLAQVIYINKSVTIQGGYTAAFTERPDPEANPTTLDAGDQGRVIYIEGDVQPTIEGLRITGGDPSVLEPKLGGPVSGGGIYIYGAAATLRNNNIFGNTAYNGGGVHLENSAARLENNTISANISDESGGGLFLSYSPAALNGNKIAENSAANAGQGGGGGGLWLDLSAATLSNNTIISNTAEGGGGLVIAESDNIKLSANTIMSNTATESGGGLDCRNSDSIRIGGNKISYNTAPWGGGLDISCTGLLSGNLISHNSDRGLVACGISIENNMITANNGGGVFLWECGKTELKRNIISENTAAFGAGVQMGYGEYTLINNVIADNLVTGGSGGSGIHTDNTTVSMSHNTLARNHGAGSTAIYVGDGTITLTNSIIVSNTVGVQVHLGGTVNIESTLWGSGNWSNGIDWEGDGTINLSNDHEGDPDFVDYLAGDYHIGENSDAIDLGIDARVIRDIDFHPRPFQDPDIGADEYWPPGILKFIYLPMVIR